jgi:hypothetical protein
VLVMVQWVEHQRLPGQQGLAQQAQQQELVQGLELRPAVQAMHTQGVLQAQGATWQLMTHHCQLCCRCCCCQGLQLVTRVGWHSQHQQVLAGQRTAAGLCLQLLSHIGAQVYWGNPPHHGAHQQALVLT